MAGLTRLWPSTEAREGLSSCMVLIVSQDELTDPWTAGRDISCMKVGARRQNNVPKEHFEPTNSLRQADEQRWYLILYIDYIYTFCKLATGTKPKPLLQAVCLYSTLQQGLYHSRTAFGNPVLCLLLFRWPPHVPRQAHRLQQPAQIKAANSTGSIRYTMPFKV